MSNNRTILTTIVLVLVVIFGYYAFNNARTPGEKISDGFEDIGAGINDTVKDATN